jgi:hypothetical protein
MDFYYKGIFKLQQIKIYIQNRKIIDRKITIEIFKLKSPKKQYLEVLKQKNRVIK